jgi:hypothetical protein
MYRILMLSVVLSLGGCGGGDTPPTPTTGRQTEVTKVMTEMRNIAGCPPAYFTTAYVDAHMGSSPVNASAAATTICAGG